MSALLSQIVESLWGLGVPEESLRGIRTEDLDTFKKELKARGITDQQFSQAQALAEWRPSEDASARQNLGALLNTMGIPQPTIDQIIHSVTDKGTFTSADLITAASSALGGQVGTNLAIKMQTPEAIPAGAPEWNPFRGDKPKAPTVGAGKAPLGPMAPGHRPYVPSPAAREAALRPLGPEGGGPGGPGGPGGAPGVSVPPPPTPAELRAQLEMTYGWAASLMDQPELAGLMQDVMTGKINVAEAGRRFLSTDFYKSTTTQQRDWMILQRTSPADAQRLMDQELDKLQQLGQPLGLDPNSPRLKQIAELTLRFGWTDDQVQRAMASEVRYDPTGQVGALSRGLKEKARQYLVPVSDQTMQSWATAIAGGTKTDDDFGQYMRDMAKSYLPSLAPVLDDPNITPMSYLSPYAEVTAKTLGINPTEIDWTEPKWMRALNTTDPKTGQRSVMQLADWQRTLMSDDQYGWKDTTNGKTQRAELGQQLLKRFGFAS